MSSITIQGRKVYFFRFTSLANAKSFALKAVTTMGIVMGDCPQYWVATPADASRLVKAGYEGVSILG